MFYGHLLTPISVCGISIVRVVFVVQGQWNQDESWAYNPMLVIETAEIGGTLIALSVPGLKPLVEEYIFKRVAAASSTGPSGWTKRTAADQSKTADLEQATRNAKNGIEVATNQRNGSTGSVAAILQEVRYSVHEEDRDQIPLKDLHNVKDIEVSSKGS